MKSRNLGEPEWSIPLHELDPELRRTLNVQLREFIDSLETQEVQKTVVFTPHRFQCEYLESCWKKAA